MNEAVLSLEEDRDLASLFSHVPIPLTNADQVIEVLTERLASPVTRRIGLPQATSTETALEVDLQARNALFLCFARALVPLASAHGGARMGTYITPLSRTDSLCVAQRCWDSWSIPRQ